MGSSEFCPVHGYVRAEGSAESSAIWLNLCVTRVVSCRGSCLAWLWQQLKDAEGGGAYLTAGVPVGSDEAAPPKQRHFDACMGAWLRE